MAEVVDLNIPNLEENFYRDIESFVQQSNTSYIDAIIHWSENHSIELEYLAPMIIKNLALRAKVQGEAENLNFLKKITRLPI